MYIISKQYNILGSVQRIRRHHNKHSHHRQHHSSETKKRSLRVFVNIDSYHDSQQSPVKYKQQKYIRKIYAATARQVDQCEVLYISSCIILIVHTHIYI